jgi:cytochrome c oxidase assembly protein subunit 15
LLLVAAALGTVLVGWLLWRTRGGAPGARLKAITALTLFLTFDLIVFGAFTRLSDSGLGCPDWPGCYAQASPLAAKGQIAAAQQALPNGPVTHTKAWIEMVHRYLAMTVGALIISMLWLAWRQRAMRPGHWRWAALTLAWVMVQGLFGKYTVTLKLYPAIVTAHLLGGLVLLALLVLQFERLKQRPLALGAGWRAAVALVLALLVAQVTLGGWVSTNYAVLACQGFPTCNQQWWPAMDFEHGFTIFRELGRMAQGGFLPVEALVAIHMVHRMAAGLVLLALWGLAWRLWRTGGELRRPAVWLAGLSTLQLATGLANVVLNWPLVAALLHTAGAAAMIAVLVSLLQRCTLAPVPFPVVRPVLRTT